MYKFGILAVFVTVKVRLNLLRFYCFTMYGQLRYKIRGRCDVRLEPVTNERYGRTWEALSYFTDGTWPVSLLPKRGTRGLIYKRWYTGVCIGDIYRTCFNSFRLYLCPLLILAALYFIGQRFLLCSPS